MSKPILLPRDLRRFLHAHFNTQVAMEMPSSSVVPVQYCESIRPALDPMLEPLLVKQGYVRDFTPCGQVIHWRLK